MKPARASFLAHVILLLSIVETAAVLYLLWEHVLGPNAYRSPEWDESMYRSPAIPTPMPTPVRIPAAPPRRPDGSVIAVSALPAGLGRLSPVQLNWLFDWPPERWEDLLWESVQSYRHQLRLVPLVRDKDLDAIAERVAVSAQSSQGKTILLRSGLYGTALPVIQEIRPVMLLPAIAAPDNAIVGISIARSLFPSPGQQGVAAIVFKMADRTRETSAWQAEEPDRPDWTRQRFSRTETLLESELEYGAGDVPEQEGLDPRSWESLPGEGRWPDEIGKLRAGTWRRKELWVKDSNNNGWRQVWSGWAFR